MISRRTFLKRAGMAAAAGAAVAGSGLAASSALASDKTISGSSSDSTYTIEAGHTVTFDPNVSSTWTISGSGVALTVRGTLVMRPASSSVVHTLRFTGGGEVLVTGAGKMDLQGTTKTAWNRTGTDANWANSDVLKITPTAKNDYSVTDFTKGGTVPSVSTPYGTFKAEVFNLTRNVVIEGTSSSYMKRVFFSESTVPQTIKYVELRYIGDSQVVGFYPLHFHFNGDATRGSLIEGVVVHDADHHAFVSHGSHGMTFRNCVGYKIRGDAFWWDPPVDGVAGNETDDTLWENCLAVDIVGGDVTPQGETAGFYMGGGVGNKAIGCVAVASEQWSPNSGFHWGSKNNGVPNTWTFEDCISHNNGDWGVFVWQNTGTQGHFMTRYVGYHNGRGAVKHGAYNNWGYHYIDNVYWENGEPVALHAQVAPPRATTTFISWQNTFFGGDPCLKIADHVLAATGPTIFLENTFGGSIRAYERTAGGVQLRGYVDFVRNLRDGRDLEPSDFDIDVMSAESRYRIQRRDGTAFQIDGPNGAVSTIATFFDEGIIKPVPPAPGTTGWQASCGNQ